MSERWGRGRYLKKEVEKAFAKENDLFGKTHLYKGRAGMGNGKWVVKKTAKKKLLKEYIKVKRANAKYYY